MPSATAAQKRLALRAGARRYALAIGQKGGIFTTSRRHFVGKENS